MEERDLQPNQQESPGTTTTEEHTQSQPQQAPSDEESDDEGEEFEFEFPFLSRDSPAGTAAPADELFADGRIRPLYYPVFRHTGTPAQHPAHHHPTPPRVRGQLGRLFLEESRARNSSVSSTTSSSDGGEEGGLDGAPPESYCLWTPGSSSSPRRRKSGSTGSMARWRRISELVVGRSHSDGKEKFMFFPLPPQPKPKATAGARHDDEPDSRKAKPSPGGVGKAEVDDAAHRAAIYGRPRRTFLPYREGLVGFFANVNGVSRSHQYPF